MADNVTFTTPSFAAATDEVTGTGEHVQIVKLAIATDGSRTLIPADATNGLQVNTELPAAAALADATANPTLPSVGAFNLAYNGTTWDRMTISSAFGDGESNTQKALLTEAYNIMFNGTTWDRVRGDTTSGLWVQVKADATQVSDDAAFTPGTTKVVMAGFTLDNTSTDVIDEGDAGAARITTDRRQIVQLGESGAKYVRGGGSKTDTSAQSLMAASGDAATSNYLCWVTIYNSSATNTAVEIRDGTTTVVAVIPAPAYGGATFVPTYPIKMTANTATNAYAQTGVTTLYVYGGGYTCV